MLLNNKKFKRLISAEKISKRIKNLAGQINKDYKNQEVLFVCVLDGSFMFAAELYKNINIKSKIAFVKIKSYKGTKSSKLKSLIGLDDNKKTNIIVIEDIVDTGKTIKYIKSKIKYKSFKIATLLSKPEIHGMNLDYVGFEIPNKFVIGYGLDYNGDGRNLSEIYQIS